jgi:ribonuclease P protein component
MKNTTPPGRSPEGRSPQGQAPQGQAPARHYHVGTGAPPRGNNETHLSTEQQTTQTHPRIPRSHEQPRRAPDPEATPCEGAQAADNQHPAEAARLSRSLRERLPQSKRIRKRAEFLRLQRVGRRRAGKHFVVITEPRRSGQSRIGITASRHVGGAVVRNRVKRLVREFFRRHQHRIAPPQDVLVIARPGAAQAGYAEVRRELAGALKIHAPE